MNEPQHAAIARALRRGWIAVDAEGRVSELSGAASDLLPLAQDAAVGTKLGELFSSDASL